LNWSGVIHILLDGALGRSFSLQILFYRNLISFAVLSSHFSGLGQGVKLESMFVCITADKIPVVKIPVVKLKPAP
jgi:hypothetical protein